VTAHASLLTVNGRRCYTPYATSRRYRCARTTPLNISYTLSAPAEVTLAIERDATSILWHGGCLQAGAARHPGCRFEELVGTVPEAGASGQSKLTFDGVLAGRALPPGRYRLTAVPQSGGLVGAPRRVRFEVQP
jgi:hypothetical protein